MKELTVIFFCSWKFALTFPLAVYGMKMSFTEVLLYTNLGGIIGVLFFAYLSHQLIRLWNKMVRPRIKKKPRQVFSKRKRRLIKLKNKYGLPGIVILNPIVISIPFSTFLIVKYYGLKKRYMAWLIAGQVAWSFVYTVFYTYIREDIAIAIHY